MATTNVLGGQPGCNSSPTIATIEPVSVLCHADLDVHGVALEIADDTGAGVATILDPDVALDLTVRLSSALAKLRGGPAPTGRMCEAQRLITVLRDACGMRQLTIAEKLGVGDSVLSMWRHGRQAPSAAHLAELRRLVKAALRHH
jgi:hypothetical protein